MTLDVLSLVTSVQFSSSLSLLSLRFCWFCRDRAFSHSLLMMASSSSSLLWEETFIVINLVELKTSYNYNCDKVEIIHCHSQLTQPVSHTVTPPHDG